MPAFIPPCQPTLRPTPPTSEGWQHEVKFDGYRIQIHKAGGRVRVFTRNGADYTKRFASIADSAASMSGDFVLDAEAVADSFHDLHLRRAPAIAFAFDVLWLGDTDLRYLPLFKRLERMPALSGNIRAVDVYDDPIALLTQCEAMGLEGIVSKRLASPYRSGRSLSWVKVKTSAWRAANRERFRMFEKR